MQIIVKDIDILKSPTHIQVEPSDTFFKGERENSR